MHSLEDTASYWQKIIIAERPWKVTEDHKRSRSSRDHIRLPISIPQ